MNNVLRRRAVFTMLLAGGWLLGTGCGARSGLEDAGGSSTTGERCPGTILCEERCVNPSNDPANCGGCNMPCAPSVGCVHGVCVPSCAGPLSFLGPPAPTVSPTAIRSLVTADANGDGNVDILLTAGSVVDPKGIAVLLGHGDGTFEPEILSDGNTTAWDTRAVDLDGNGTLDLVQCQYSSDIGIVLGVGDGTFVLAPSIPTPHCGGVTAGDINADGFVDLVVTSNKSPRLFTLLGHGDGTFEPLVEYSISSVHGRATLADWNMDGLLDVTLAQEAGVAVFLNGGGGVLNAAASYDTKGLHEFITEAVDLNGDGLMDIVVSGFPTGGDGYERLTGVLLNEGNGLIGPMLETTLEAGGPRVAWVNADEAPDFLAGGGVIWLGHGDGTFEVSGEYPLSNANALDAPDLNGDGLSDLVAAYDNNYSGAVTIQTLLNLGSGRYSSAISFEEHKSGGGYGCLGSRRRWQAGYCLRA